MSEEHAHEVGEDVKVDEGEKRPKCGRPNLLTQILVLLAAFFCQMISIGFAFSLGVLFVEFVETFPGSRAAVSWATSLCSGILFGAGLLAGVCIQRAGPRVCTIVGGIIAAAGVLASSFVNNLTLLYFTFGLINGFGLCLVQLSSSVAISHHFQEGRAAATSIAAVGAGIGSLSFPVVLRFLIDYYHWRGALMVFSAFMLHAVPLGILFVPVIGKIPTPKELDIEMVQSEKADDNDSVKVATVQPEARPRTRICEAAMWKNILYIIYLIIAPIISTGYSFPYVTLVDLGLLRGVDKARSTWLVTYISITTAVSTFLVGLLLKYLHKHSLKFFDVSLLCMGAVLLVFPSLVTYPALIVGAVAYGVAMGALTGTYAIIVLDMIGVRLYATGFGFICTGYGIGYLLGTPVAGWVTDLTGSYDISFYIAGSLCLGPAIIFIVAQLAWNCRRQQNHSLKNTDA